MIYLPQNLLLILAAIFMACGGVYFAIKRHGYCICIAIGIMLGCVIFCANETREENAISPYLDQTVLLSARVADADASYIEGMVSAILVVNQVDGQAASFSCYAVIMPEVVVGELIEAEFTITHLSDDGERLSHYSDGVFVEAAYLGSMERLGHVAGWRGFFIDAQEALSRIIRAPFSAEVGGVLAAMTVGDRTYVSSAITELYRKAGLSHVLVVSGLHLTLMCSMVLIETSTRRARLLKAAITMSMALLLAGITGGSSSILRAVLMLALCTVASLIDEHADSVTSLALAAVLLMLPNGYLACSLSFQLSFLATLGVVLGAAFAKKTLQYIEHYGLAHPVFVLLYNSIVMTSFATLATVPILVLWQMNISLLALLSNILTFWMISYILAFGFVGALVGLVPFCTPLSTLILTVSAIFVGLLNRIVEQVATLPGAQLYFETEYAAILCVVVIAAGAVAHLAKVRYRVAVPCIAFILAAGVAMGNYLARDVIKIAMVGTSSYPAIVISQNETAMVLYRGGTYNTQTIETYLDRRGITTLELVVDLRSSPTSVSGLDAVQTVWLFDTAPREESYFSFGDVAGSILHTDGGGVVVLDFGGTTVAVTSGSVVLSQPFTVDILLATASSAGSIVGEIAVCRNLSSPDFISDYAPEDIYYGQDSASIWLRYGGDYQLMGVQNGE